LIYKMSALVTTLEHLFVTWPEGCTHLACKGTTVQILLQLLLQALLLVAIAVFCYHMQHDQG
jgi:hypothetical protein